MSDDEVIAAVTHALEQVFRDHGVMLGKHVVVAEVYEPDGDRAVWLCSPEGQPTWDSLGLVRYADHVEAAALVTDE